MKIKSFLIVIIIACASLHIGNVFGDDNKNWLSSWWSKINPFSYVTKDTTLMNKWGLTSDNFEQVIFNNNENKNILTATDAFSAFLIDKKVSQVGVGNNTAAQQKIKEYLSVSINNDVVNPTATAKIDALTNKEGFLRYIPDKDALLTDACKALIEDIAARVCTTDQKVKADKIDKIIARIRKNIGSRQSLHAQMKEIEKSEGFIFAQAYISVYLKLQHQIAMEQLFEKK